MTQRELIKHRWKSSYCEPSVKVILDRTLTPKDESPRREIYVERCGLMYGPYKSAAHARQHGFVLPETTEAE